MARDPQKIKKAYDEDRSVAYKLPDHILKDLDEDQIKDLSAVYNMMSADEKKEFGKGTGDLMDLARQMSDPLQEKYNTGGLDSWTGKPKENSNAMQGPMPMPSAKKKPKEVGGDKSKSSSALAVIPKPDTAKDETLVDEEIDPRILKLLGIEDTTGLDYSDYKSLLKEKMAADRMGGNKGDSGDAELLTNEYKRIKGSTGKFKVKSQKIKAQSFVAKTKPSSSVKKVTPLLPSVTPQETEQPIQPERQGMDKTLALIASKLNSVDKNVQQTTSNLQNKDVAENKQKNQDRLTAENTAAQRKEERVERAAILGGALAGMKKTVKPLTDMMGGLFDFFKRLGFAMFIMELLKFLKDPKKYINGVIEWINKQIVKLETSIENFVIGTIIRPLNKAINDVNDQFSKFIGTVNPILEKLKVLGINTQIPDDLKIPEIPESSIRDNFSIPSIPLLGETSSSPSESSTTQPESQPKETLMGRGRSQSTSSLAAKGGIDQGERAKSQVSEAGFDESDFILYRDVVAEIESKGKYDIQGGSGDMYAGRYQMGAAAREDAARLLGEKYQGDDEAARKTFREDKQMQERYFAAYTRANHGYLMKGSPEYKELSEDGKLQVLGYAHNAGWSRAADWLKSGMSGSFKDEFGTRSDKYSTSIRSAQQQVRQPIAPDSDDVSSTTEPAPTPTSALPITVPLEDVNRRLEKDPEQFLKDLDAGKLTRPNPYTITPPVQKASLTTIGGLTGGDVPGVALAAAGGIQSQAYSFSASNGADLSILSTKETLRVVGT